MYPPTVASPRRIPAAYHYASDCRASARSEEILIGRQSLSLASKTRFLFTLLVTIVIVVLYFAFDFFFFFTISHFFFTHYHATVEVYASVCLATRRLGISSNRIYTSHGDYNIIIVSKRFAVWRN